MDAYRRALLCRAVVAVLVVGLVAFAAATDAARKASHKPVVRPAHGAVLHADRPGQAPGKEVASLRTRNSRTYRDAGGQMVARLFPGAVNYRNTHGSWSPIRNELVNVAGGAHRNGANAFFAQLPSDLSKPVRFSAGADWVEFGLRGGQGSGAASGASERYANAFPGVSDTYTVESDRLRESLTLAGPDSRSSFVYDVSTSGGLRAREARDGGIDFRDRRGKVVFRFLAPYMYDRAGNESSKVSLSLRGDDEVVLKPDARWLESKSRQWPVTIDPDIQYPDNDATRFHGGNQECTIKGGTSANNNYCSDTNWLVGWNGTNARRALFRFDVQNTIPRDSQVMAATFGVKFTSQTGTASTDIDLHPVKHSWTTGVTWNKYDGTNAWATPGGEIDSKVSTAHISTSEVPDWQLWTGLSGLVQDWVDGTRSNNGLLIKDSSEQNVNNVFSITSTQGDPTGNNWPYMDVWYHARTGAQSFHTLDSQELNDPMTGQVNVANGNFLLRASDLRIGGTGLDLSISRTYNSLNPVTKDYGNNWTMDTGGGVQLDHFDNGDVALLGPSGFWALFKGKQGDGTFSTTPAGLNARLEEPSGGFTVGGVCYRSRITFNESREKLYFTSGGKLGRDEDRNGNPIVFYYTNDPQMGAVVSSITDTRGRTTTVGHDSKGLIDSVTDSSGRDVSYVNDAGWNLASYTDANGKTTGYDYTWSDGNPLLTQITDPKGNVTNIDYDSQDRVHTVERVLDPAAQSNPTTTFAYYTTPGTTVHQDCVDDQGATIANFFGRTIVTDANGHNATYCYDKQLRVLLVVDARGKGRSRTWTSNNDTQQLTSATAQATKFTYENFADNRLQDVEQPPTTSGGTGLKSHLGYDTDTTHRNTVSSWYLPTSATDTQGNTLSFAYDTNGNVSTVDDGLASQNQLKLDHNSNGTISKIWEPNDKGNVNPTTSLGYNANGELTSIDRPSPVGDETFTYDSLSRPNVLTDGRIQTTDYDFDPMDRVTSMTFTGSQTVSYGYDDNGNNTSRTDNTGQTTYSYDRLNRLTQESFPGGQTNTYTYDAVGNLKTLQDGGGTSTYNYGISNLLDSMLAPGDPSATTFGYDDDNRRTSTAYPNGVTMTATFDNPGRLTRIKADKGTTPISDFQYDYTIQTPFCGSTGTDTNLRQKVTDNVAGTSTLYCYDKLNRLVSGLDSPTNLFNYNYDGNGNVTRVSRGGTTTSYGYNQANELCWSVSGTQSSSACSPPTGATTYSYDTAGNLTSSSAGLALGYNSKEQTTSMTGLTGGSALSMTYAGPNQFERVGRGSAAFTNNALGVGTETNTSGTAYYRRDNDGALQSERQTSGNRYYYTFDGLGSVAAVTSSGGTKIQSYSYDPYGTTTLNVAQGQSAVTNPWKYAGAYQDSTGFYKMGVRYYRPELMRWTQQDPVENQTDVQQINRYAYVGDDPSNAIDPTGLSQGPVCTRGVTYCSQQYYARLRRYRASKGSPTIFSRLSVSDVACGGAGFLSGLATAATGVGAVVSGAVGGGVGLTCTAATK